jgi:hypothetical protein
MLFPSKKLPKERRSVDVKARQWDQAAWFKYLVRDENIAFHAQLGNPDSKAAKTFRKRFRVPWLFYKDVLLPWTISRFPHKPDAIGRMGVPPDYKLLATLRCLGRAAHFDDVAEACNVGDGGECFRTFFHKWCHSFVEWGMPIHIKPPDVNSDELRDAMRHYSDAGLDGCFCSIDGVHFKWDRTTFSLKNTHIGKHGYPTRGYQVVVLHNRKIIHVTKGVNACLLDCV